MTTSQAPARPRDPLEEMLAEIWRDVLRADVVGIDEPFDSRGGQPASLDPMLERVEQVCGQRIPSELRSLRVTIAELADGLRSVGPGHGSRLYFARNIGAADARPPLFYLHGDINGGGFYCLGLAAHLGSDQPLYALAPHGANGEGVPATIEDMAAQRLRLVRTLQPAGPYQLGGHCNGALVAFEMACQLATAGERVDQVLLISPPIYPGPLVEARLHAVAWAGQFRRANTSARLQMIRRVALFPFTRPAAPTSAPRLASLPRDPSGTLEAYRPVLRRYRPRRYAGAVTVFWPAEEGTEYRRDPWRLWPSIAPRAEVIRIPGAHLSCITVNARELGHAMRARLRPGPRS